MQVFTLGIFAIACLISAISSNFTDMLYVANSSKNSRQETLAQIANSSEYSCDLLNDESIVSKITSFYPQAQAYLSGKSTAQQQTLCRRHFGEIKSRAAAIQARYH